MIKICRVCDNEGKKLENGTAVIKIQGLNEVEIDPTKLVKLNDLNGFECEPCYLYDMNGAKQRAKTRDIINLTNEIQEKLEKGAITEAITGRGGQPLKYNGMACKVTYDNLDDRYFVEINQTLLLYNL